MRTATVREAAAALGLSVRTVQADVRRGCRGVSHSGRPGRGRGALLDLATYAAHRRGDADPRAEAFAAAGRAVAHVLRETQGATARRRSALAAFAFLDRLHAELFGQPLEELPPETEAAFRVLLTSASSPRK